MKKSFTKSHSVSFLRKTRRGSIVNHNVERYLRNDISNGIGKELQLNAKFFIIPTQHTFLNHLNILEDEKIQNVIILTTVLREVQQSNRRVHDRILNLRRKPGKHFFLFANEYHQNCYVKGEEGERESVRNRRCIAKTIEYYAKECPEKPILLIVKNPKLWESNTVPSTCQTITLPDLLSLHFSDLIKQLPPPDEKSNLVTPPPRPLPIGAPKVKKIFEFHYPPEKIRQLRSQNVPIFQGVVRMSRYNPFRGKIELGANHKFPLVQISGRVNMNRAIDGDLVVIQILQQSLWDDPSGLPCAKVVAIVHRKKRIFCGSIREGSAPHSFKVAFEPVYKKYPLIIIRTRQTRELLGMRIRVQLDEWHVGEPFPKGHYLSAIGPAGTLDTETEVLLEEHEIPHEPFPQIVLDDLPSPNDWEGLVKKESSKRRDLRSEMVLSIDPPGCTDIDDALHVKPLDGSKVEIGVHIADVSFFVKEGTAIDISARERCTSVYLVQKRISMLPRLLSDNLCSIRQGVERLTFSVIWTIDTDTGNIEKTWFGRTIVKSRFALTYQQAQRIIDNTSQQDQQAKTLRILHKVSLQLRNKRFENGALSLCSPAVKFGLGSDRVTPTEMAMYETGQSHHLVEEFMLLANISVAEKLVQYFPETAVLRKHPAPIREKFLDLNHNLQRTIGLSLDLDHGSLGLSKSLDRVKMTLANNNNENPHIDMMVKMLATRCMQQAVYFPSGSSEEKFHYGLAVPLYTHFTSPIRRYADILVHRQLDYLLLEKKSQERFQSSEILNKIKMEEICSVMNERGRMAQIAGRESVGLYTEFFFRGKNVQDETACVVRLTEGGIAVFFPKYGFEDYVSGSRDGLDGKLDPQVGVFSMRLRSGERREFRMFDSIRVNFTAKKMNNFKHKIQIEMLPSKDKGGGGEENISGGKRKRELEEEDEEDEVRSKKRKIE